MPFAHACALVLGLPGGYLRIAFYRLRRCSFHSRVPFGSFFAHPETCLDAAQPRLYSPQQKDEQPA